MIDKNLQAALRFKDWWPDAQFFPAIYKDGTHQPLVPWSKESSGDMDQLHKWAAEYGERSYFCVNYRASNLLVLDVDNKNGKEGSDTLANLCWEFDELPQTTKATTPSGGEHYIFNSGALKGKYRCNTSGGLGKGLDIPAMTPVAGSTVPGKGDYALVHESRPNMVPAWLSTKVKALGEPKDKAERKDNNIEPDLPQNIARASEYLANRAESIAEGHRDTGTYQVACNVRDFGVSQQMAEQLMLTIWLPRQTLAGDWDADDVVAKVDAAYQYAESDFGSKTAEGMGFKSVAGSQSPYLKALCADSFGVSKPKPRLMLFDGPGGLPAGIVGCFAGQGGAGKSQLAGQMSAMLASGTDCLGGLFKLPERAMRVLYVACEDDRHELEKRLHLIRKRYGKLDLSRLHVIPAGGDFALLKRDHAQNLVPTKGFDDLYRYVQRARPDLIILDPAAQIAGPAQIDSNNGDATALIALLGRVRDLKCSVVLVHHASKASVSSKAGQPGKPPKRPENVAARLEPALAATAVRGASALTDNARWTMTMTLVPQSCYAALGADKNESVIAVSVPKSNYAMGMSTTFLKRVQGVLEPFEPQPAVEEISQKELERRSVAKDAILGMIGEESLTKSAVAKRRATLPGSFGEKAVRGLVDELIREGKIAVTDQTGQGGGRLLTTFVTDRMDNSID